MAKRRRGGAVAAVVPHGVPSHDPRSRRGTGQPRTDKPASCRAGSSPASPLFIADTVSDWMGVGCFVVLLMLVFALLLTLLYLVTSEAAR